MKESLKAKANEFGLAMEKVTGTGKKIQLETSIGLDFVNLCSSLEVRSERPIIKLVLRGNITLLESSDSILFSGLDKVGHILCRKMRWSIVCELNKKNS